MRRYDLRDEERLRLQRHVRDWAGAGLLTVAQASAIDVELRTPLRSTGTMLRLGLAIFTFICAIAATAFVSVVFNVRGEGAAAALCGLAAVAAFVAADQFAGAKHFHRHGVEEALAVCAVAFATVSVVLTLGQIGRWSEDLIAVGLTVAAGLSVLCYVRFGFQYAAIAALVLAALIPLPLEMRSEVKRLFAAAVCAGAFVTARVARSRASSEILEDDADVVSAAAFAGIYIALNLQLVPVELGVVRGEARWFWWLTYACTWLLPVAGLWRAIGARDRTQLRVSVVLLVVTLVTNKPYLGWARNTWDPMLLGVVLMVTALVVRRWLASGADHQRGGFTADRILPSEEEAVQLAGLASAAVHMRPGAQPVPTPPTFGDGRSGGGGATGSF